MEEQLLRAGRRGREIRPFCQSAGVTHRGYSRCLQRVLVDFGAESAFAPAAQRVREHYGFAVPVSAVRQWTLWHGKAMATLITQLDGSMIPIVQPGSGSDRRKGKTVQWREARLCCARSVAQVTAVYGVTLGSPAVAAPGKATAWRRRQQGRLLDNRSAVVLRSLEKHLLANPKTENPARTTHRYLADRRDHLDYAGARKQNLPIGSGEIESAHRHVIQHRLKIAGGWWTELNMEAMLQLRAARANNWWSAYWAKARN